MPSPPHGSVRMMSELLTSIKLIKMYAWEQPFAAAINELRDKERKILTRAAYLQSVTVCLLPTAPAHARRANQRCF